MIDIMEIREILPHRYPFLMVDRILELEPGKRIVGLKNVTVNEEFFQGHFPGQPVMPGVLQIEALAQVAGVLAFRSGAEGDTVYFMSMDKVKFRRPVVPGDQLLLMAEVMQQRRNVWKVKAQATVDDQVTAEGELTAMVAGKGE